jgi:CheY-like chemotaxis protein
MADAVAELGTAATDFTNLCHKNRNLPNDLKINYSKCRNFAATVRVCPGLANALQHHNTEGNMVSSDSRKEKTILVVEDAEAIRKLVCTMLSHDGYQCLEAGDGAEALEIVERADDQIHMVLTDVMMPQMGGPELARHLSVLRPNVRIIFMSGYTEDPLVRRVERVPSIFLPKPFTATMLTHKVRESFERPWTGLPGTAL